MAVVVKKFSGRSRSRHTKIDWPAVFQALKPGKFVVTHPGYGLVAVARLSSIATGASAISGRRFVGCVDANGDAGIRED